ncbi:MAG: hypothetical protein ABSA47_03085 [Verrucomicrobiota bacterium]
MAIVMYGEPRIIKPKSDLYLRDLMKNLLPDPRIVHIHFKGGHYWVSYGKNREFFRRVRR